MTLSRKKNLSDIIIFVDGQCGCGKTLLAQIISSLKRVELLTYAYEIEMVCALSSMGKISLDAAHAQIVLFTDLRLYNTMMGREVNFRSSDLSSVFRNHNPLRYFRRLFQPGDAAIPELIQQERPILNLTTHNLLGFSEPLWQALGNRCVFIEIIRHPLYMIRQQKLNMDQLLGNVRYFTLNIEYKNSNIPFYARGWEEIFINSNAFEKSIYSIYYLSKRTEEVKRLMKDRYHAKIISVPFEKFVIDPMPWIKKIENILDTEMSENTLKVMREQNIPRKKIAEGIDLDIYRRCGWLPALEGADEKVELQVRKEEAIKEIDNKTQEILTQLCEEYETNFLDNV